MSSLAPRGGWAPRTSAPSRSSDAVMEALGEA